MSGVNITVYDGKSAQLAAQRAEAAAKRAENVEFYNLRNELPAPEDNILPTHRPNDTPVEEGDFMEVTKGIYRNVDGTDLEVSMDMGRLWFNGEKFAVSVQWDLKTPDGVDDIDPNGTRIPSERGTARYAPSKLAVGILQYDEGINFLQNLTNSSLNDPVWINDSFVSKTSGNIGSSSSSKVTDFIDISFNGSIKFNYRLLFSAMRAYAFMMRIRFL